MNDTDASGLQRGHNVGANAVYLFGYGARFVYRDHRGQTLAESMIPVS